MTELYEIHFPDGRVVLASGPLPTSAHTIAGRIVTRVGRDEGGES